MASRAVVAVLHLAAPPVSAQRAISAGSGAVGTEQIGTEQEGAVR